MHSSISNFNEETLERIVPEQRWEKLLSIVLILFVLLIIGWEVFWRQQGYGPTLNDNKGLWALTREKLENQTEGTVLIGSSRMLFDFNLSVWEDHYGHQPIQLSTVGTNASYYLKDIALNTKFKGILLVGITPPLYFVPEGFPVDMPKGNLNYYKNFGPSKKWSQYLGMILESYFAFIQQDDLTLKNLIKLLPVSDRPKAQIPPKLPPYFMEIDHNRQGMMTTRTEKDENFQHLIQNTWVPLFTPPPPPPHLSFEEFKKMFDKHVNNTLDETKKYIQIINQRGGKVIFIRFPSSNKVRELENKFAPRKGFWDRLSVLANESIHFEDYQQLKNFKLPEWSHLSRSDAKIITKEIISILDKSEKNN